MNFTFLKLTNRTHEAAKARLRSSLPCVLTPQPPAPPPSRGAKRSRGMHPLQDQLRATAWPKPQTRKSGLTSMGFTPEISPALENLQLGFAGGRRNLYFRVSRVCSAWEEGAGSSQTAIFNPSAAKAPRTGRDLGNHPGRHGIPKQINTVPQGAEPIHWAWEEGSQHLQTQPLGPVASQELYLSPCKADVNGSFSQRKFREAQSPGR